MSKDIKVLYHGNCFDGMASAWAAWRKFKDRAEYIPCFYGDKKMENGIMQDCFENANINYEYYILDFSFPRDLMIAMANKAKKIVVLDHHKTAQANCKGLDFCIFDMEKSGARLAWEYLHSFNEEPGLVSNLKDLQIPQLIQYVEDRDLWRYALPFSKEINAFIQSWPMTIEHYEEIYLDLESSLTAARTQGMAIERYKQTMVEAQCKKVRFYILGGYKVPVVNSSILFSEVGHQLCKEYPTFKFAAYYVDREDGLRQWGLHSIGDFDVSEVAKKYNGGGHKNAAGFVTAISFYGEA